MFTYLDLRLGVTLLIRVSLKRFSAKVVDGQRSETVVVAHATAPTMGQLSVRLITMGILTVRLTRLAELPYARHHC